MIRTTYTSVIRRCIINLVIIDISRILSFCRAQGDAANVLQTDDCSKALLLCLETNHRPRKGDIIDEILRQYGLFMNKDETDFYHEKMGHIFDVQIDYVKDLIGTKNYTHLYNLSHAPQN